MIEPLALGLLVALSVPGVSLAVATFSAFLARQPFKIAVVDWRRGRRYTRTIYAERFLALYLATALLGLLGAVSVGGTSLLWPLLMGAPFGLVQLYYDANSSSRSLIPELAGPAALGTAASSIAVAGGWPLDSALALWAVIAARAIPSVIYVRARLRLEKGRPSSPAPFVIAGAAAVVGLSLLALAERVPWLAVAMIALLLARGLYGLSRYRRPAPAKVIGLTEMALGLITVVAAAFGYARGI